MKVFFQLKLILKSDLNTTKLDFRRVSAPFIKPLMLIFTLVLKNQN